MLSNISLRPSRWQRDQTVQHRAERASPVRTALVAGLLVRWTGPPSEPWGSFLRPGSSCRSSLTWNGEGATLLKAFPKWQGEWNVARRGPSWGDRAYLCPVSPEAEVKSPNHWTTKEFPKLLWLLIFLSIYVIPCHKSFIFFQDMLERSTLICEAGEPGEQNCRQSVFVNMITKYQDAYDRMKRRIQRHPS